jgi:tetratricopeptide (TPR) repeat protein
MGLGRWSTTVLLASLVLFTIAGVRRAPLISDQVQQAGGLRALALRSVGLGHLVPVPEQPFAAVKPPAWATTDLAVQQMQQRLTNNPSDPTAYAAYAQLGSLYLQKVRETGDPSYYVKAEGALQKSLELAPNNVLAVVGMGGLSLARHAFDEALEWGERARQVAPGNYTVYGIIGDAYIELGRYPEAIEAFQEMIDRRPDLPSMSRVSYARELHGDLPGAIMAMEGAVGAGNPMSEGTNWARIQLGNLHFLTGDLEAAERQYRETLRYLPDYVHGHGGLAKVAAARGKLQDAIELYTRALTIVPLPEYAIALGDAYRAAGNSAMAARQDDLVRVIAQLNRSAGMDVDLEMALFEVDHAKAPAAIAAAVQTARAQYARRPSVHVADVLAWSLYRANQPAEALPFAREALKLGSKDPVMLYHAGAIAAAAGQAAEAQQYLAAALEGNPNFHPLFAPEARRLLDTIRRAGA